MSAESFDKSQIVAETESPTFDEFRSATHILFDCEIDGDQFRGKTRFARYGDLVVADIRSTDILLHCSSQRPSSVAANHVAVVFIKSGTVSLKADIDRRTMSEGDVIMLDLARSYSCDCKAIDTLWFLVPRVSLAIALGDPSVHLAHFPADLDSTSLLWAQAQSIVDLSKRKNSTNADTAVEMFSMSLAAMMQHLRPSMETMAFDRRDQSMLGRMCRYIDSNLSDPNMSADTLGQAFNVSRATVFRMFHKHGGVAHYIRNVRLDRAFVQLSTNPYAEERLNVLAHSFGFGSGDSFARAFEGRFGMRPIQFRRGGLDATVRAKVALLSEEGLESNIVAHWLVENAAAAELRMRETP